VKTLLKFVAICHLLTSIRLSAHAQYTTFTYQGQVLDNGSPFTGAGQFEFALVTSTNISQPAVATAVLTGSFVTSYNLVSGGNGYTVAPAVHITGGGGSGATATATLSGGVVNAVIPGSAGTGYTSPPTVTIDPPPVTTAYTTYWSNDGTSANGSEPANPVSVTATGGLFTVTLGNTNLANMTAIPAALFAQQTSLQLRIWFSDGVNGFSVLSPPQNLTPAPYSVFATYSAGASNLLGTLPAAQLSGTIPATDLAGTYGSALTLNNPTNSFSGAFLGNGSGLTNLNASQLTGGTVPNSVLPGFQGSNNAVGGGAGNMIVGTDSVIAGGLNNTNNANQSAIGGGGGNLIQSGAYYSVIAGGGGNLIQSNSYDSFIGSGYHNFVQGNSVVSVINGGQFNAILTNVNFSVIGGGYGNTNAGNYATIPGGYANLATGSNSFAAGSYAHATNHGAFVWSDDSATSAFSSTNNNSFNVRAAGGVQLVTGGAGLSVDGQAVVVAGGNGAGLTNLNAAALSSIGNTNGLAYGNFFAGPAGNPTNSGSLSTAIGYQALESNSTGSGNSAYGSTALFANTTGSDNLAMGSAAMRGNVNGSQNTGLGYFTLYYNVSGWQNTAVGGNALGLLGNSTGAGGSNNIAVGFDAAYSYTGNESGNIVIGSPGVQGENNTIRIGNSQTNTYLAGVINGNGSGLTNISTYQILSPGNNGLGQNYFAGPAGNPSAYGGLNTAVGNQSMSALAGGGYNTALGATALLSNTNGSFNTSIGAASLFLNRSGSRNTVIGMNALYNCSPSDNNTVVGIAALQNLAAGTNNIALGSQAGINFSSNESSNVDIGNPGLAGDNNLIRIGTPGIHTATFLAGTATISNSNAASLIVFGSRTGGYGTPLAQFQNLSPAAAGSPVLRLIGGTGNAPDGVLSVSSSTPVGTGGSLIAEFGNPNSFVLVITNDGSLYTAGDVYARGTKLTSDRNAKENFTALDSRTVLEKVAALPLSEWNYKNDPAATRHVGPVAQDFHAAFGLDGADDKHISVVDEGGVALAAIQGLNEKVEVRSQKSEERIQKLETENAELKQRLAALEKMIHYQKTN